ncbi:MAG: hypothetical protein H7210_07505 [Pyrinomonadaceae bacterium]|nr:hypothetical protein [Phycisphaerales bacterium]
MHKSCLVCLAKASAEPAEYRLCIDQKELCILLVTPNRWLSQSIEADLMHTGDDLGTLLAEELSDTPSSGKPLTISHFRSQDKLYSFRTPLPIPLDPQGDVSADPTNIETSYNVLMSYQNVFSALGDMQGEVADS